LRVLVYRTFISILLIFNLGSLAKAAELQFGKDNEWVIFNGPILFDEIDEILSELREKEPKLIMLNSYGGEVSGAMRLAKYVRENEMNTWVAENSICASACALVFVAGVQRLCQGKLIVHQALPKQEHEDAKITMLVAWVNIQNMIGEMVVLLNNFGTPQFVLETMLVHRGLYQFSETELAQLNTVTTVKEITE